MAFEPPEPTLEEIEQEAQSQYILDAASELIIKQGYTKTTLDAIAKYADIPKDTIQIHWATREDLFDALMKREQAEMAHDLHSRVSLDPIGSSVPGMFRNTALALMARPLLKAMVLRDITIMGEMAQADYGNEVLKERFSGFTVYLDILRIAGLVRTDMTPEEQVYIMSAVFMGFFLVQPLLPKKFLLSDERVADLIAETVQRTLAPHYAIS